MNKLEGHIGDHFFTSTTINGLEHLIQVSQTSRGVEDNKIKVFIRNSTNTGTLCEFEIPECGFIYDK